MIDFRNAEYLVDGTTIACEIFQNEQWLSLTLNPNVTGISTAYKELYIRMVAVAVQYTAPEVDLAADARKQRDRLLVSTVDAIIPNALVLNAMSETERAALETYRQALLDVPNQEGFPENIVWPTREE